MDVQTGVKIQDNFQQGNTVTLTSTENCKSLLVLTTDLNSTCKVGHNMVNSPKEKGGPKIEQCIPSQPRMHLYLGAASPCNFLQNSNRKRRR
jgi:hypothetical protein